MLRNFDLFDPKFIYNVFIGYIVNKRITFTYILTYLTHVFACICVV